MNKYKNKEEVLNTLNISSLTLDNWIKKSIPEAHSNNMYNLDLIYDFIKKENKLSNRANKKHCVKNPVSKELLNYLEQTDWIKLFWDYISDKSFLLVAEELVHTLQQRIYKMTCNDPLEKIMPYNEVYAFSVAYQILLNSGDKSRTGSYYTPKFIVRDICENIIEFEKTILEPCCGVGFFVIEYIKIYLIKFKQLPQNLIFCNDIDPYAVQITKLNIEFYFPDLKFQISCENGLNLQWNKKFDFVVTNPPYGIKNQHENLKTTEIFSQFIYNSLLKYLSKNGVMNFVLPSSFLSVSKHKEIRKIILEDFFLDIIKFYGKSFEGVFSDIIYIQVKNQNIKNDEVLLILQNLCHVSQQSFIDNNYIISINNCEEHENVNNYYKVPHISLKNANYSLGIVTGNNKFFISEKKKENTIPILSGKEICAGNIIYKKQQYILNKFESFQQKPQINKFSKPKIIYRFISNKIVTAVDYSGALTLNSANFFTLDNIDLPLEYVSALLNSDIVNKIHKIKNGMPLKVLKQHLQKLPLFIFSDTIQKLIVANYKKQCHKENNLIIEKQIRLYLLK